MTISREALATEILALAATRPLVLVGIDGCGGAGKSTLARELAAATYNSSIVQMDDFFLPPSSFDWRRLLAQVIEPLRAGREAQYQRFDWHLRQLVEWRIVACGGVILVEGVCSTRLELRPQYDLTIWVDCAAETRLSRGVARDGEAARERWLGQWMPAEDEYVRDHQPRQRAHFIVNGAG